MSILAHFCINESGLHKVCMLREFNFVDRFMALHFLATGAPLAARYI
jgi:hypothetical protein